MRRVALLLALVLAVPAAATPPRDGPSNLQTLIWRAKPVFCGGAGKNLVSLTFDDGPSPFTEGIVAALRAGQARATFFDVGNRLAFWPDAVRATATVGSMGVHTWTHAHLPRLKPARVRDELLRTQLAIFRTTRQLASVFRPPYEQATVRDDERPMRPDEESDLALIWPVGDDELDPVRKGVGTRRKGEAAASVLVSPYDRSIASRQLVRATRVPRRRQENRNGQTEPLDVAVESLEELILLAAWQ